MRGKRIKPRYMTQIKSRPPTFVLLCSRAEDMPESYKRYLVNGTARSVRSARRAGAAGGEAGKNPFADGENP